jgi:uncharacterized protein HemX
MNKENYNVNEYKDESASENVDWGNSLPSDLSMGDITESDFGSKKKSNLNKGTIFLLVTCAIGVGVMYLFGIKQKPKEASAEQKAAEAQVDQALQKLVNKDEQNKVKELFNDTDEMVKAFYDYPTKQQVALDELKKNPFQRVVDTSGEVVVDDRTARQERERLVRELQNNFNKLKLQSVLKSSKGATCLINGEIYKVGQMVDDFFTVKTIEDNKVILVASEMEFVLEML